MPPSNGAILYGQESGPGRPWLYPWNRRLRHLNRVVIRNIAALSEERLSIATRSVDDDDLPETLHSPEKLLALEESEEIVRRSHSSVDLQRGHDSSTPTRTRSPDQMAEPLKVEATRRSRHKTRTPNLRRRSTLEWAHASSQQRQSRLQQLAESRLVTVFYSLHVDAIREPVYISEVVEHTMNPDFCQVDLETCGPYILRAESVKVKVWTKRFGDRDFMLSMQSTFHLRHLTYVGKTLAQYRRALPPNCLLLELTDGIYVSWTESTTIGNQQDKPATPDNGPTKDTTRLPATSTFDALLRLSKLDDSVQDALALRQNLKADLDRTVESNHRKMLADADSLKQKRDFLKTIEYAKTRLEKQLQMLRRSRDQGKETLTKKRQLLEYGREQHDSHPKYSRPEVSPRLYDKTEPRILILQQRRRICETISKVYPILPVHNQPLFFTIRGLHLPSSDDLETASPEQVAGALGHVAHTVQLLAFYLSQPLPYPVFPRSGTSTIHDPISVMGQDASRPGAITAAQTNTKSDSASRIFPLYSRGVPRFRFEYGVFLLNKNIELLLSNVYHVRVLDIRQTLPNLLYVLYCATAGTGELPARKAGGIRGLLRTGRESVGREDGSDAGSDGGDDGVVQSFRHGMRKGRKASRLSSGNEKGTA